MHRWLLPLRPFALFLIMAACLAWPARAQTSAQDMMTQALRQARNPPGLIGVIAGGVSGTYLRIAADLAAVLDDGETLRVLPVMGRGSVQNIADLLYLRGIDVAIVQSDVLAHLHRQNLIPNESAIQYIAKLYEEEVHVLARDRITRLEDLSGQTVNVDVPGSGTAMTASMLFDSLGIKATLTNDDQATALEKLKRAEIAAMVFVAGKPAPVFATVPAGTALHFLPIPLSAPLVETYVPSRLEAQQYPTLIPADAPVDTIAVGAVMATIGASPGTDRARRMNRFVDALFAKFDEFLKPGRHPKWREVSLGAQVPGWTRYPEAQILLQRQQAASDASLRDAFDAFLSQSGRSGADLKGARREALFREFLQWRSEQPAAR